MQHTDSKVKKRPNVPGTVGRELRPYSILHMGAASRRQVLGNGRSRTNRSVTSLPPRGQGCPAPQDLHLLSSPKLGAGLKRLSA